MSHSGTVSFWEYQIPTLGLCPILGRSIDRQTDRPIDKSPQITPRQVTLIFFFYTIRFFFTPTILDRRHSSDRSIDRPIKLHKSPLCMSDRSTDKVAQITPNDPW